MRLVSKSLLILGGLAVLAVALVQWRAGARERAAEAAFPPEGQFVDFAGYRAHAVVMGDGADVVLIHGASGSTRDWTHAIAPILAERYRVIAIDRPGFGYSDPMTGPEGGTLSAQAEMLRAVAKDLGAEKPIVVGHSYGGAVALAWGTGMPETLAGLVTIGAPAVRWPTEPEALYRVTSSGWGGALVVPLITAFVPQARLDGEVTAAFAPQAPPEGFLDHFGVALSARRATLKANAKQRVSLKPQVEAMLPLYAEMAFPLEVIHGESDPIVSAFLHVGPLVDAAQDANLTLLPGIGHMPQHVAPQSVIEAIDRVARRAGLN